MSASCDANASIRSPSILDSWMAIILWGITIVLIIARIIVPEEVFGQRLFGDDTLFGSVAMAATLFTLLGGIAVVAIRWWWWRTQEFIVTNYRLVLAWGVINKSASDSSLEKINDAQLEISWLGRLLDYGRLEVLTAAPIQGADMLNRLNHAKEFKKAMMTAKHDLQSNGGDGEDYRASRQSPEPAAAAAAAAPTPTTSAAGIDVSGGDRPHARRYTGRGHRRAGRAGQSCAMPAPSPRRSTRPRRQNCSGACDRPS